MSGLRRAGLLFGLSLVASLVLAGGASAAVTGLSLSTSQELASSENKTSTASCPAGKQVLGAAGTVGGVGQVAVHNMTPAADLQTVFVEGLEDENGIAAAWAMAARAICATPPLGLQRVSATSASDSTDKGVVAACPSGKRILGGGGEITGGAGQVQVNDVVLGSGLQGVTARGQEDQNGTLGNWSVTAFAVCATTPAGLEQVSAQSLSNSNNKSVTATCPAGKQVVGAGGEVTATGGQVVLTSIAPNAGLTSVTAIGSEDEDGTAGNWQVNAFAVCANAAQRAVTGTASNSDPKGKTTSCPSGKVPTGGGADITGGNGQARLYQLILGLSGSVQAAGTEDATGFGGSWLLRTYAICATPLTNLAAPGGASASNSLASKTATVTCSGGQRVVGASGNTSPPSTGVGLDSITPSPDLTSVTVAASEDETGITGNWRVEARPKCADPPPGLELVSASSDPDSDVFAGATATCPAGKNLLGTGGGIDDGGREVVLDDLRPNERLTSTTVTGIEDETGFAGLWGVTAHAICANP